MTCDPFTFICEIQLGQLFLIIFLAIVGISVAMIGLADDLAAWWKKRQDR